MKPDRALEILTGKWFSITYSIVMCLGFAAVASFLSEPGSWTQLFWTFGSGMHGGMALMWVISPQITKRWRKQMETEIELMVSKALIRSMREANVVRWQLASDESPSEQRRLQ